MKTKITSLLLMFAMVFSMIVSMSVFSSAEILTKSEKRAINSLLLGANAYYHNGGSVENWTDEEVCMFIYGKLLWDEYGDIDATHDQLDIEYESNNGYWAFDLETIQSLTQDALGRELPKVSTSVLKVNGDKVLIPCDMDGGSIDYYYVQDVRESYNYMTVLGSIVYTDITGSYFMGHFRAEIEENPDSVYGYTLRSLSLNDGDENTGNLTATASSELIEPASAHFAEFAIDGDINSAWVEAADGVGINEWIKLQNSDGLDMQVSAVEISFGEISDRLVISSYPRKVLIECSNGYKQTAEIVGDYGDCVVLEQTQTVEWIKISILDTYTFGEDEKTAISEIDLHGISTKCSNHITSTTITKATLSNNGWMECKCLNCGYVDSSGIIYSPKTFTLSTTKYTYNGKVKTPSVTVKDSEDNVLEKDVDYTVKYESGRKNPGRYTVTITFKGNYSGTKKLYFTIIPKAPTDIKVTQTTSTITLKWNKVVGADAYVIYRYNTKTKKYEKVKEVTGTSAKISKLKAGTEYTYKVKAYTEDDGVIWGKASEEIATATKCAAPKVTVKQTTSTITLKWNKVKGADGYTVYKYNTKTKKYEKVKSVKGTSLKIKNLKAGTAYTYKVKAYTKIDDSIIWGVASEEIATATKCKTPKITKLTTGNSKANIAWSNVSGESGYQVYYSTKKDSGYKKLGTYKANTVKTSKKLTKGKTYYFKVRAYKTTDNGTVYSSWSSVKSIRIK